MDGETRTFLENMEARINTRLDRLDRGFAELRADHGSKLVRLVADVERIAIAILRIEQRLDRVESR
jgi:hypothetical protein